MNAIETIKSLISNKIEVMNLLIKNPNYSTEAHERMRNELMGMLVCLKNINDNGNFYCINYWDNAIEFGYYDTESKWIHIA